MNCPEHNPSSFLTCERNWIYYTLIFTGGFWGAYTYILKGGVFCNAQTGNVVLMAISLGSASWGRAIYYLIPISAYIMGAFISEMVPNTVKHTLSIRWDTLLILIEIAAVLILGFLPESVPVQVSQVIINFIASMQYNTFRQAEGIPVATTFVTNHVRQVGVGLAKEFQHRYKDNTGPHKKMMTHLNMLLSFIIGGVSGTIFCGLLAGKAIWITLIPLAAILTTLLHADLTTEKNLMKKKPSGH